MKTKGDILEMAEKLKCLSVTTIVTLSFCLNAFAQEAKGKDWTEEEWKNEKGSYGWVFPHIDKDEDGTLTDAEYGQFQEYKKKHPNWEIEFDPNARQEGKKPTPKKSGSGNTAWVGVRSSNDTPEYMAEQPLESLSPEVELAIMKKLHTYDKIMNIQEMPQNAHTDEQQAEDVSDEWLIFVTMSHGQGMHKLTLKQEGEDISGSLEQLIYGPYPWVDPSVLDRIVPADGGELNGSFTGSFLKTSAKHNLFYLHRKNPSGRFEAIFSAVLSVDGQTAIGQLVNTGGMHGTMLMVRRIALSRYKHLLESDTVRKTEPVGTKKPGEVGVDDIPQGVEALEAALNEKRMAQAVKMFKDLDKNKDGKISVSDKEVPPEQFQNKAWIQANLNGDMNLTWEEELIWQYNAQKREKQKEPRAKKSSTRTE
jgi:hypothetical protein